MKPRIAQLTIAILVLTVLCAFFGCSDEDLRQAAALDTISPEAFMNPPLEARPGAYWCWLNGHVDHERMTREMEEAKALGMRGFEIWDIGVYRPVGDQFLPEGKRITRTNLKGQHTKDSPLVSSGLLGPVTLQPMKQE